VKVQPIDNADFVLNRKKNAEQDYAIVLIERRTNLPKSFFFKSWSTTWRGTEFPTRCKLARLGLGRAYVVEGHRQGTNPVSRISGWKDADPDIPIFHRRKSESARLQ
jgi:hypothetical protein